MYKDVMIGATSVPMIATASTVVWFKKIFARDLLVLITKSVTQDGADLDFVGELAYIMAMQGAKSDMQACNFDTFIAWMDQFTAIDLFNEGTQNEIIDLFIQQQKPSVEEKKKADRRSDN